ncbi:MAG TPA: phosphotransferase [Candidatus Limnocylindrales bacterium]|nr:phosphotransferase [Candidatus Limnocylindrales bacterium]
MSQLLTTPRLASLSTAIDGRKYPEHPHFPQLKIASDPDLMLRLFREVFKPSDETRMKFEFCVPIRFRWRSDNSHCVLQYSLRPKQNHRRPAPDFWITAFIYPGPDEAAAAWAKQLATLNARPSRGLPPELQPLAFVPELHMLAHIFPYDWLLPNLAEILAGPWGELKHKLLSRFGQGHWEFERKEVEPLRYLAEDSAVVRYTLEANNLGDARRETKRFYAKAYRTRYGEQIGRILHDLHQNTADPGSNFTVVEPVFYCAQRRCLVLAEAPGRSFQDLLMFNEGDDAIAGARSIARALAAFHQIQLTPPVSHSAEQQIGFLDRAAELLRWACPDSSAVIQAVTEKARTGLRDVQQVPIHWDLKTDHIFLDGERVIFIDLDTISLGDPARDAAHLAAHIACRIDAPDIDVEVADVIARAFVDEFFNQVPASWRRQFQLQFLIALVEGACGLFKRQEPRWADRAEAILRQAERALAGELQFA